MTEPCLEARVFWLLTIEIPNQRAGKRNPFRFRIESKITTIEAERIPLLHSGRKCAPDRAFALRTHVKAPTGASRFLRGGGQPSPRRLRWGDVLPGIPSKDKNYRTERNGRSKDDTSCCNRTFNRCHYARRQTGKDNEQSRYLSRKPYGDPGFQISVLALHAVTRLLDEDVKQLSRSGFVNHRVRLDELCRRQRRLERHAHFTRRRDNRGLALSGSSALHLISHCTPQHAPSMRTARQHTAQPNRQTTPRSRHAITKMAQHDRAR